MSKSLVQTSPTQAVMRYLTLGSQGSFLINKPARERQRADRTHKEKHTKPEKRPNSPQFLHSQKPTEIHLQREPSHTQLKPAKQRKQIVIHKLHKTAKNAQTTHNQSFLQIKTVISRH